MACVSPLTAYRNSSGGITFTAATGFRDKPVNVACGQCIGCRTARSAMWATRILHEAQTYRERNQGSSFVTLTYTDECLPTDAGLNKRDHQLFLKRLRKHSGPFRYFLCGEYGDQTRRPHYHAILFGLDFQDDRVLVKQTAYGNLYYSYTLEKIWGLGQTRVGEVSKQSATYVAKYCVKRKTGPLAEREYYRRSGEHEWHVEPEYAAMSLKPAIGTAWFRKYNRDVFPSDDVVVNGKRVQTPKLYDRLWKEQAQSVGLPESAEISFHSISDRRRQAARKTASDNTSDRREVKRVALEHNHKLKKGSL